MSSHQWYAQDYSRKPSAWSRKASTVRVLVGVKRSAWAARYVPDAKRVALSALGALGALALVYIILVCGGVVF